MYKLEKSIPGLEMTRVSLFLHGEVRFPAS